jgi:PAS domain S-box-containing protein
MKIKKPIVKKKTRQHLEDKVRQQTDELKIRDGKLKQGAHREKEGATREKQGATREKQGATREKQGANREKIAEEEIHIRTKAMESTFDGIFIIDAKKPGYPIIYANPSFYHLTGLSKNEVIGKNYFLIYGPDENWQVIEEIKNALKLGKSFHGEMLHVKKNGEKFWSLLRIAHIRDKHGVTTHYGQ